MLLRVCDAYTGHRYTTAESVVAADPERYVVLGLLAFAQHRKTPLPSPQATATEAAESIEAHEEAM